MTRKPKHAPLMLAALLAGLGLTSAHAQQPGLMDLVAQAGIRAVDPAQPATELDLPDLQGRRARLSDYQGEWVLLTFFATWCGPCRSEMPSLQVLHDSLHSQGFTVLGVSLDDSAAKAQRFVQDLGVSFPVLWDESGQASRAYRANSIPLSYLIDPRGRIVGMARGARNWSATKSVFASILTSSPAEPSTDDELYADAQAPVDLPRVLTPPSADWHLAKTSPRPGEAFRLDVRIEWAGTLQDYLLHPPEVTLPEGVVQTAISAESTSLDGRSVLTYQITLQIDDPGLYDIDPIEIRYTPAFESTPVASRIAGPTVEVLPKTFAGMRPAVAASVGGMALASGLGIWAWLAARRRPAKPGPGDEHQRLVESLSAARHLRLEGDIAGFLQALASLEEELGEGEPDEELASMLEQVRYGGGAPDSQELDRRQRAVERLIEKRQPTAEVNQLRFRPGAQRRASMSTREEVSR